MQAVQVPVIAAGGIATPAGVAAAKALGAAAVQIGTAYLCSHEATTSALHRAALQSSAAQHTALTNLFTGRPARGIVNRVMRELGAMHPQVPAFPLATADMAPLRAAARPVSGKKPPHVATRRVQPSSRPVAKTRGAATAQHAAHKPPVRRPSGHKKTAH